MREGKEGGGVKERYGERRRWRKRERERLSGRESGRRCLWGSETAWK